MLRVKRSVTRRFLLMNPDLTLSSLRDGGHKITNVRRQIINIFSQAKKPLSAQEIIIKLKLKNINVNKTTVYRELQFLHDNNYLIKVHLKPHETSYEYKGLIHHHHLVCESCGKIDNITNCLADELESEIFKKRGFKVKRHSLEFYGICSDCKKS